MRKVLASLVALSFVGAVAMPALAAEDCAAQMKTVEAEVAKLTDATKKTKAEGELKEAKAAADKKNEKECMEYVDAAKKTAGVK